MQSWAVRVAQIVDHLPSKGEGLSSNPSPIKKKKQKTTTSKTYAILFVKSCSYFLDNWKSC
jgi:hypothetical protein